MIKNETTEWPVSIVRIQFKLTKPTAMTVIKPQICPTFSSTPIDKINNINDKTYNVNAIFSNNQNQKMLITVKKWQCQFLCFLALMFKQAYSNVHTSLLRAKKNA